MVDHLVTETAEEVPQTPIEQEAEPIQLWLEEQRAAQIEAAAQLAGHLVPDDEPAGVQPAPATASLLGGPITDGDDELPRRRTPRGLPVSPLSSFYAYVNGRPGVDKTTCGQAAIGSMLDFHGKDPFDLPETNGHWRSGEIIDALKNAGYGPDVLGGVFGTSPGRIRDALRAYTVPGVKSGSSGLFFSGWADEWNRLLAYVYYSALPVPVLVVASGLGAHWPIVWKMERTGSEMMLYLANWSSTWGPTPMRQSDFLTRWACGHLPLGFNHAAVYCGRPKITF